MTWWARSWPRQGGAVWPKIGEPARGRGIAPGQCPGAPAWRRESRWRYFFRFWSTFSRRSLPTLKKGSFFGATWIFSPVFGLRPV